jgi:hypothetical protein
MRNAIATAPTVIEYAEVVRRMAARSAPGGTRIVGIDGPAGSGKSTFAARLLRHLPAATLVTVDDFVSWVDPYGWWPRFTAQVLEPLSRGRDARYQARDWVGDEFGDALGPWKTAAWAPVIVVEGAGCARQAAAPYLAYAIWVQAPDDLRLARGLDRDGEDHRELWVRWMAAERDFYAADGTRGRADLRVDAAPTFPHDPEREFVTLGQ